MSSLMYPKVFSDYMARLAKLGPLLKHLPTRVYWYAMVAGDAFTFDLTKAELPHLLINKPTVGSDAADSDKFTARVELMRVSAVQRSLRTVVLKVQVQQQGAQSGGAVHEETQQAQVKDTGGVFVFEGPMADPAKPMQQVGYVHTPSVIFLVFRSSQYPELHCIVVSIVTNSWAVPWPVSWRRWR